MSSTDKFEPGWPKYKDHDPRTIAQVYKEKSHPYQVRTADGTYSRPKGQGNTNSGSLTKDKAEARTYKERVRPGIAGFVTDQPGKGK